MWKAAVSCGKAVFNAVNEQVGVDYPSCVNACSLAAAESIEHVRGPR